jgi:hypothetical protein
MLDLLVLTNSDMLLLILKIFFFSFYKTMYANKEVNRIEPSTSIRVPCFIFPFVIHRYWKPMIGI